MSQNLKALFLDRDGVINTRIPGRYVKTWEMFEFRPTVLNALTELKKKYDVIVIVTNQQGIGKGIMTVEQLEEIHAKMIAEVIKFGGQIDKAYYSPYLTKDNPPCRKPNTGMAFQALSDFPNIDFQNSVMVGDSISDIEFGRRMGMKTVLVSGKEEEQEAQKDLHVDLRIDFLEELVSF